MNWRFRKSFSPLPGVRITLSPSGLSTSVGVGPIRATIGARGAAITTNIPGTGISFRQTIGDSPTHKGSTILPEPKHAQFTPEPSASEMSDIKSAGSGVLTTPGLGEFKRLLEQSIREHSEISKALRQTKDEESINMERYTGWKNGWLFRKIFKNKYAQLQALAEESTSKRAELEEQELLSRLQTQISIPEAVAKTFHRMNDDFDVLTKSYRIWDTIGQRNTIKITERTTATRTVERKPVRFRLGNCEIIESEWKVPHLENANGGDIFFYPAFALYFISQENFALLEYKDIELVYSPTHFIEEETLSDDSTVVGHTWAKANKDGSPDKRFKDNYQIPIVQYGKITITSITGMNEEYMVSYAERAEAFSLAWNEHSNAIAAEG